MKRRATGSGVSGVHAVVYVARHEGKEAFLIGNFSIDLHAGDEEIFLEAERDINRFYARHLPDGTVRPKVVNFHRGALFLSRDEEAKQ